MREWRLQIKHVGTSYASLTSDANCAGHHGDKEPISRVRRRTLKCANVRESARRLGLRPLSRGLVWPLVGETSARVSRTCARPILLCRASRQVRAVRRASERQLMVARWCHVGCFGFPFRAITATRTRARRSACRRLLPTARLAACHSTHTPFKADHRNAEEHAWRNGGSMADERFAWRPRAMILTAIRVLT